MGKLKIIEFKNFNLWIHYGGRTLLWWPLIYLYFPLRGKLPRTYYVSFIFGSLMLFVKSKKGEWKSEPSLSKSNE